MILLCLMTMGTTFSKVSGLIRNDWVKYRDYTHNILYLNVDKIYNK